MCPPLPFPVAPNSLSRWHISQKILQMCLLVIYITSLIKCFPASNLWTTPQELHSFHFGQMSQIWGIINKKGTHLFGYAEEMLSNSDERRSCNVLCATISLNLAIGGGFFCYISFIFITLNEIAGKECNISMLKTFEQPWNSSQSLSYCIMCFFHYGHI